MPAGLKLRVKCKWRNPVCELYRAFGDRAFSTTEAEAIVPRGLRHGMFAFMRDNGTMEIASGERRAHCNSQSKKTYWKFSQKYADYLKNGGLKELEEN